MRLIDADELINILEWNKGRKDDIFVSVNEVINMVNSRPTAYSTDNVVERLEEKTQWTGIGDDCSPEKVAYNDGISDAIEIVKGGGVDE